MNRLNKQRGFTLVELAIVLVIIGLIVSSVLVGQDMIKSAELRSTVSQFQSFQNGVSAFINKYKFIPGDIDGETYGLIPNDNGVDTENFNGNKDGIVGNVAGTYESGTDIIDGEMLNFWSHLTSPGKELIPGSFTGSLDAGAVPATNAVGSQIPAMKTGATGWAVYGQSGKNYLVTGISYDNTAGQGTMVLNEVWTPLDAFNIDDKLDDGIPTTGIVRGMISEAGATAGVALTEDIAVEDATLESCINDDVTPVAYQFSATAAACSLRFELSTF